MFLTDMMKVKWKAAKTLNCEGNDAKLMRLLGENDKCALTLPDLGYTVRRNGNVLSVTTGTNIIIYSCSSKDISFNFNFHPFKCLINQFSNFNQYSTYIYIVCSEEAVVELPGRKWFCATCNHENKLDNITIECPVRHTFDVLRGQVEKFLDRSANGKDPDTLFQLAMLTWELLWDIGKPGIDVRLRTGQTFTFKVQHSPTSFFWQDSKNVVIRFKVFMHHFDYFCFLPWLYLSTIDETLYLYNMSVASERKCQDC